MRRSRRTVLRSIGATTAVIGSVATRRASAASCPLTLVPGETQLSSALSDDPQLRRDAITTHAGAVAQNYADEGVLPATDPFAPFDFQTYDPTRTRSELNDGYLGTWATGFVESDDGEPVPGGQEVTTVATSAVVNDALVVLTAEPELNVGGGFVYGDPTTPTLADWTDAFTTTYMDPDYVNHDFDLDGGPELDWHKWFDDDVINEVEFWGNTAGPMASRGSTDPTDDTVTVGTSLIGSDTTVEVEVSVNPDISPGVERCYPFPG